MGLTAEHYKQQLTVLEPQGPALPKVPASNCDKLKAALADEFGRLDDRALALLEEADPRTVYEMLRDWEAFADLPDCFTQTGSSLEARRTAVTERITRSGGQNQAYMKSRARAIGHEITITETNHSSSGGLISGDELSTDPANRFAWQVNVEVNNTFTFVSGVAESGEELGYWQPIRLECLLERLKPAQTQIIWNYLLQ